MTSPFVERARKVVYSYSSSIDAEAAPMLMQDIAAEFEALIDEMIDPEKLARAMYPRVFECRGPINDVLQIHTAAIAQVNTIIAAIKRGELRK